MPPSEAARIISVGNYYLAHPGSPSSQIQGPATQILSAPFLAAPPEMLSLHSLKCCLYMATESPLLPEELWTPPGGGAHGGSRRKDPVAEQSCCRKAEPSRQKEWGSELCAFPRGRLSRERPNIGVERKSQRRNIPTLERLSLLHKCPDKKIKTHSASGKCSKTRKKTLMLKGQRKRRNASISAAALDEHLRRQDEKEHH